MTTTMNNVIEFERSLKVGDKVHVFWTNSYCAYRGQAEVTRVNAKSIRVRLLECVPTGYSAPYPAGQEIVVPSLLASRWSWSNRVAPIAEEVQS